MLLVMDGLLLTVDWLLGSSLLESIIEVSCSSNSYLRRHLLLMPWRVLDVHLTHLLSRRNLFLSFLWLLRRPTLSNILLGLLGLFLLNLSQSLLEGLEILLVLLVLLEGPWFNDVVSSFNELFTEVLQDALAAPSDNSLSDRFKRVAIDLNVLQSLMLSDKVRKSLNIIIRQRQLAQSLQEMEEGSRHLIHFVTAEVDHFQLGKR
mmetsp:Transcript_580/g.658  ORF Transcript_580/g.658 Transcript_580/m.658 type:complete len:205 (-) Transcript_580:1661-2275(-)